MCDKPTSASRNKLPFGNLRFSLTFDHVITEEGSPAETITSLSTLVKNCISGTTVVVGGYLQVCLIVRPPEAEACSRPRAQPVTTQLCVNIDAFNQFITELHLDTTTQVEKIQKKYLQYSEII